MDPEFDDDSAADSQTSNSFFLSAIAFEGGLGAIAIVLGIVFGPHANQMVPTLDRWDQILTGLLIGMLCALPMLAIIRWLERLDLQAIRHINEFSRESLVPMLRQMSITELAVVSLCAGVGEELLFRGWLQMLLTGSESEWTTASLAIGILLASFAFGIAHAISRLYVLVVFIMGIIFGVLLVVTGNLLVPIAAHAMFDFVQLIYAVKESSDGDSLPE